MIATNSPHDDLWQVRKANDILSFAGIKYDSMYHAPVYPLFLKCASLTGIPLRLVVECMYVTSIYYIGYVLTMLGINPAAVFIGILLSLFSPYSFQLPNRFGPEIFLGIMTIYACAFSINTWIYRQEKLRFIIYTLLSSVFWAIAWNTRKESIVLAPFFFVFIIIIWLNKRDNIRLRKKTILSCALMPIFTAIVFKLLICEINYIRYGLFATTSITASGFESTYKTLQSIDVKEKLSYIPITHCARKLAYNISPSFKLLEFSLEGDRGAMWAKISREFTDSKGMSNIATNEISSGWIYWAVYEAAIYSGYANTPKTADDLFSKINLELNNVIKSDQYKSRPVYISMLNPDYMSWISCLPKSLIKVYNILLKNPTPIREHKNQLTNQDADLKLFDQIGNRRSYHPFGNPISWKIQNTISTIYYPLLKFSQLIFLVSLITYIYKYLFFKGIDSNGLIILLFSSLVLPRVLLFSLVDASSWPGDQPRYLYPIYPEYLFLMPIAISELLKTCYINIKKHI